MRNLNDFATKRTDRIAEALDIYHVLYKFDLKNSLSDDTFNAFIRFNKQYLTEHIDDLISSIPSENKTFDHDKYTVSIYINQSNILVINIMTKKYHYLTLREDDPNLDKENKAALEWLASLDKNNDDNDNQKLGQSTII